MGPDQINDLPAHILLVHLVVVLVPMTALLAAGASVWPNLRARLGIALPLLGLVSLILVPVTTNAGEWLLENKFGVEKDNIDQLPDEAPIRDHVELADDLLPWVIGLFVITLLVWATGLPAVRSRLFGPGPGTAVKPARRSLIATVLVAVLAVGVGIGVVQQVIRTGDSGSESVWQGTGD